MELVQSYLIGKSCIEIKKMLKEYYFLRIKEELGNNMEIYDYASYLVYKGLITNDLYEEMEWFFQNELVIKGKKDDVVTY